MRGRKPEPFVLSAKDQRALQQLLRDGQTPLRIARRAQILLSCAEVGPVMVATKSTKSNHRLACVSAIVPRAGRAL
jgi:hypothetical protein